MARSHPVSRRHPYRAGRLATAVAVGLALAVTGVTTAASATSPKPHPGPPQVSGHDVKLPAGVRAVPDAAGSAATAQAAAASPTSIHAPATTAAPQTSLPTGPPSTDAALKPVDLGSIPQSQSELSTLRAQAAAQGSVHIIVTLRTTFRAIGTMTTSAAQDQQASIQALSDQASAVATAKGATVVHTYGGNIPAVAMIATPAALDALAASSAVAKIDPDNVNRATDATTTPLIGASDAHDRGFHGGGGAAVAILDTGAQYDHPSYSGRVTNAACFSAASDCPAGGTAEYGNQSGQPCTFAGDCDHGTHVTGIAAGGATASYPEGGVADQAKIETIRVFHLGTCNGSACALAYDSDIIAGLNQVYNDRGIGTAAANISIGGGSYTSNCDSAKASLKTAIDNLRSVNIATVIAAGNDYSATAVSSPGCISTADTIGATDNSDAVANFSNSNALVDYYAPGVSVLSSIPGSGYGYKSGTSMATPQVVGSFAVLKSAFGTSQTLAQWESDLGSSGPLITDSKSGLARHRINVLQALGQETITLTNDALRDLRNPIPNDHLFATTTTAGYWSAVAVRPPVGADYDLSVYDNPSSGLLATSGYGGSAVDFVAQDNNSGRRAYPDTTYPVVHKYAGTGRYQIEYANDAATVGAATYTITMSSPELIEIRDSYEAAGVPTYYRVVPTNAGQDPELYLMASTAGSTGTYMQGRSSAVQSSTSGLAGAAEGFVDTAAATQYDGLVLINHSGSGDYTLYKDTSAPTGSVTINNGDASTASRNVTLGLSAADAETGVMDMRISTDGTFDTEAWQPYSTSASATLPTEGGTKTVSAQFRDNAGAVSTTSDTITLTATKPGAPTMSSETPSAGAISVAFTAPANDGNSTITSYSASCKSTDGGATKAASGATSPILVSGLTGGKQYRCRVKAINSVGAGGYSANGALVTVPASVPGKPTVTGETTSAGAISVAFTAPSSDGGSAITSYTALCVSTNGGTTQSVVGSTSPILVSALTSGKKYKCQVAATSAAGTGAFSGYGAVVTVP